MEVKKDKKMSFFDQLKTSNIRFNPHPLLNSFNKPEETVIFSEENQDSLHVEIVKKVDELIGSLDENCKKESIGDKVSTKMKEE